MSFDRLAPHYRWMEWVLAGDKLQQCRTAFLRSIPTPERVLLLGEGNGRCLVELVRAYPAAKFTCVDSSERMLQCAEERLKRKAVPSACVEFIRVDIHDWSPPRAKFDLVITHFFLDCFTATQLAQLVPRIAESSAPNARWLLADFCEPQSGVAKMRARWILRVMYWFFQRMTRLPASRLTPPDSFLQQGGFVLRERRVHEWGLLHSDLWVAG